jgi:hypothetical protein
MRISEIEKKAKALGIKDTWKHSKTDLIKTIQRKEGNFDCFDTARNYCDQSACYWRSDCLK